MKNNPEQFDKLINNLLNSNHISEHIEQHRHLTKTDMIADTIDVVIEMREQGLSFSQIAAYYKKNGINVSPGTIQIAFSVCTTGNISHKGKKTDKTKGKSKTVLSNKKNNNNALKETKKQDSGVTKTLHNTTAFRDEKEPLVM